MPSRNYFADLLSGHQSNFAKGVHVVDSPGAEIADLIARHPKARERLEGQTEGFMRVAFSAATGFASKGSRLKQAQLPGKKGADDSWAYAMVLLKQGARVNMEGISKELIAALDECSDSERREWLEGKGLELADLTSNAARSSGRKSRDAGILLAASVKAADENPDLAHFARGLEQTLIDATDFKSPLGDDGISMMQVAIERGRVDIVEKVMSREGIKATEEVFASSIGKGQESILEIAARCQATSRKTDGTCLQKMLVRGLISPAKAREYAMGASVPAPTREAVLEMLDKHAGERLSELKTEPSKQAQRTHEISFPGIKK